MKLTMKLLALLFGVLMLANIANAESPRDQLRQMVEQLQKTPSDNALRERIIKLAQEVKPALAMPEEAERRMQRGAAALEGAKSVADFQSAAKEFEQATLAAPWYGDAYFNLGTVQDKTENYEAALRSLKLALLASPDDKGIKALIFKVEYRNEKGNSPEVQAAKRKQQEQEGRRVEEDMIRGLEGAIFVQNMNESTGSEEWKRLWKDSHFLRIQGGSVDEVERQTGSALKLGDGRKINLCNSPRDDFAPIGTERVCYRSSPFIGRITIRQDTRYEITSDGRRLVKTYMYNQGQSIEVTRYEKQ